LVGQTFVESPVTDVCGYNQSQPRREEDVHAVADLMLSFRLTQHSGRGDFLVRLNDGGKPFEVRMQFEGLSQFSCQQKWDCPSCCNTDAHPRYLHYQTYFGGKPIQNATGNVWIADAGESLVEVSLVDQQFLLAFDGRTVVVRPFHRSDPPPLLSACPLAIGARRMELTVRDVRVFRDVYYTHPIGLSASHGKAQPVRLGADEYFVLGDNSPISDDSRTWPNRGAIDAKLLVGKPFAAIPSLQFSLWGGWHFQVPNPARIRYIH
jgi:hypothetical protein